MSGARQSLSAAAFIVTVAASLLAPRQAAGQTLDLATSGGFGGGVSLAPEAGGTSLGHTPFFFHMDISGVIDGDAGWEYGGAFSVPFETRPGLAITPRLRRVRERWGVHTFVGLGVPVHVAPSTLAGVEVSVGGWYPLLPGLQVGGELNADVFFAGDALPDEGALVMFNVVGGARLPL